jgi:2-polyprenyl-3-methyl-5-hydroxy-6-metoxy-1,4-benzoquinol methylase
MTFVPFNDFEFIATNLLKHEWIFAKTMPKNPHWYTLRKNWESNGAFVKVVELMRRHGYVRRYGQSDYTCFDVNDMRYWTMGAPIPSTILINRAVNKSRAQYDQIADKYDSFFSDYKSNIENEAIFARLEYDSGSVLDIGCGTGLLLDYFSPRRYMGIDPSQKMLDILVRKHPGKKIINTRFEDFYDGQYDLIVSLFGSANYIDPDAIDRIPRFLKRGGRYFVMFFKPGYYPVTYERSGVELSHFDNGYLRLGGAVTDIGNFLLVEGSA